MELKFKLQADALNAAMDVVSVVTPRPITSDGAAGYLFVVRKTPEGKDRCYVYSRTEHLVVRSDFPLEEVEGEGAFIYPAQHVSSFKFAEGSVTFWAKSEGDTHTVRYDLGNGAGTERTTLDPKLLATCDKELDAATDERELPVAVLREAISLSRPFLSKHTEQRASEESKTIQIFDSSNEGTAKGDGYMFASNSIQCFFFQCDAFKGKALAIHGQYLSEVSSFLAKSKGTVTFKTSPSKTFAIDASGRVLAWSHHVNPYKKFSYYTPKTDKIVLLVPRSVVLNRLRHVHTELEAKHDKIKMTFDHAGSNIRFQAADGKSKTMSLPVDVEILPGGEERNFSTNVNIDHLIELFDGAKADRVELRIAIVPPSAQRPTEQLLFRTRDEFWLDGEGKVVAGSNVQAGKEPEGGFKCMVTRFMPDRT